MKPKSSKSSTNFKGLSVTPSNQEDIRRFLNKKEGSKQCPSEVDKPDKRIRKKFMASKTGSKKVKLRLNQASSDSLDQYDKVPFEDAENVAAPRFYPGPCKNREERRNLHGYECTCCKAYYDSLNLSPESRKKRIESVSRHRAKVSPPKTPEHHYDPHIPNTQECIRRGYIQNAPYFTRRKLDIKSTDRPSTEESVPQEKNESNLSSLFDDNNLTGSTMFFSDDTKDSPSKIVPDKAGSFVDISEDVIVSPNGSVPLFSDDESLDFSQSLLD